MFKGISDFISWYDPLDWKLKTEDSSVNFVVLNKLLFMYCSVLTLY